MKKEVINNSFVFYATNLEVIEALEATNPDLANEFMKAIIEYGIYGEYEKTNPMIDVLMIQVGFGIDKAKDRYTAAVENGKKGGRKKQIDDNKVLELKEKGMTNAQIANELNCSVSSIEKANKRNRENNVAYVDDTRKNRKNLNDNDNVNVNVNDNVNENANDNLNVDLSAAQEKKGEEMERRLVTLPNGKKEVLTLDELKKKMFMTNPNEIEKMWRAYEIATLKEPKSIEELSEEDKEFYEFERESNIENGMNKEDAAREAWETVMEMNYR